MVNISCTICPPDLPQITLIIPWDYYTSWKPFLCHLLTHVTKTVKGKECCKFIPFRNRSKPSSFIGAARNSTLGTKDYGLLQHNQQPEHSVFDSAPLTPVAHWDDKFGHRRVLVYRVGCFSELMNPHLFIMDNKYSYHFLYYFPSFCLPKLFTFIAEKNSLKQRHSVLLVPNTQKHKEPWKIVP